MLCFTVHAAVLQKLPACSCQSEVAQTDRRWLQSDSWPAASARSAPSSSTWLFCSETTPGCWQRGQILIYLNFRFKITTFVVIFSICTRFSHLDFLSEKLLKINVYLHPGLRELRPHGQLFPHVNIWIVRFLEHLLQLLQLRAREGRPVPPLLAAGHVAVALVPQFVQVRLLRAAGDRRGAQGAAAVQGPAQVRAHGLLLWFGHAETDCREEGSKKNK